MALRMFKSTNNSNKTKKTLIDKLSFPQGALMWSILLCGYILFVVNWLVVGRLAGTAGHIGWVDFFFGDKTPPQVLTQAINYTITFMRGIGSFLVGYLVAKLTHKWAVVISLFLVVMALPAIWMPNGGYGAFIFFRMLLAVGGTTLIVYIQPVMAKSMNAKQKGMFSIISPFGFNIGTIIAVAPFLVPSVSLWLITNWQISGSIFACLPIIPLVLYFIFGKNFNTNFQQHLDKADDHVLPSSTLKILKEKQTWVWVLVYGSWLIIAVIPIIGLFPSALSLFNKSVGGMSVKDAHNIFTLIFVSGMFLSPFTIGRWNFTSAQRKPFVVFIGLMILITFACVILGWAYGSLATFFIFGFIFGWFVWSIQGVILNNPHERRGNSPKRISTLFGFIWGFGYMFFTVCNIILALLLPSTDPTYVNSIIMLSILFIIMLVFPLSFLFVKETKPEGPIIPKFRSNKKILKKII